ncbi:MAG TPA: tetratricopeptide repeat protein [Devosia sp.]|nr:tetratricopeptide repeat protein [Devosia sp.]
MKRLIRPLAILLACSALALVPVASALSQSDSPGFGLPSPSGSFLAGQEALNTLGVNMAAQAFLDATQTQWESPEIIERAFASLAAAGRIDEAESLARHLLELQPGNNLAKLLVATVALKERRYTSTIRQMETLGLDSFIDISGLLVEAWAYLGQSDLKAAFAVLERLEGNGLENFLIFHKALMADFAGDKQAIELAEKAYEADPFISRSVEVYARVLGNAGRFAEALEVLDAYEREGLSHPSLIPVRADIEAGRLPGKYATNVAAGAAELYHGIGAALARDGASDIAMVFLQLGLYLNPKSDNIALAIGDLFDSAGRFELANQAYASIRDGSPFKSGAAVLMAANLDNLGDRDGAIAELGAIVKAEPDNVEALTALGDLLRSDEQYSRAIQAYTRIIGIVGGEHPRDWRYFYVRGIAYERNGEWEAAESDFLRALELNPDQPQVLNYLGYSWVDQGVNLEPALTMIEKAVKANPRDGYIVDSLGWAIYKMGRYEDAVRILEEAVRLLPNDPEINDHLGDAYWYAGRKREARFQWTIARSVDRRGVVTERVIPKLENGLDEN